MQDQSESDEDCKSESSLKKDENIPLNNHKSIEKRLEEEVKFGRSRKFALYFIQRILKGNIYENSF